MKLNFIIYQNNGGLREEIRIDSLARISKTIHLKYEHCIQNLLCSQYGDVVLQSNRNVSLVINQHSNDDLDYGPYYEKEASGDTAVNEDCRRSVNTSVKTFFELNIK